MRTPPPDVQRRFERPMREFIARVQMLGKRYPGGRATSWYRDPADNRRVGGNPRSQHLLGLAVDLVVPRPQVGALMADAKRVGLTAINEGDHVHLQHYPAGVRP